MTTRQFLSLEAVVPLRIASEEYGIPFSQLRSWHRRGYLAPVGRLPASVPGGGQLVFLRVHVLALVNDPPRRGRRSRAPVDLPIIALAEERAP